MSNCKSWAGDYDANDNPVKNGRLYMPGARSCGFRDCVNPNHVDREPVLEGLKECSVCGEARPIIQFGIDNKKKDGRNCECKPCRNKRPSHREKTKRNGSIMETLESLDPRLTLGDVMPLLKKELTK